MNPVCAEFFLTYRYFIRYERQKNKIRKILGRAQIIQVTITVYNWLLLFTFFIVYYYSHNYHYYYLVNRYLLHSKSLLTMNRSRVSSLTIKPLDIFLIVLYVFYVIFLVRCLQLSNSCQSGLFYGYFLAFCRFLLNAKTKLGRGAKPPKNAVSGYSMDVLFAFDRYPLVTRNLVIITLIRVQVVQ